MELRIKELCKAKGLLQKELAEKIGVTDIALRYSTNQRTIQPESRARTAEKISISK